jgi:hypothetical protein
MKLKNSVFNAAHIKYIQGEFLEQPAQILEKLVELNSADSTYPTELLCCE